MTCRAALLLLLFCSAGACRPTEAEQVATRITGGGDPRRGELAIERYGCGSCHTIPGVRGANGVVGPPMHHIARRHYLAGHLQNTPANLMTWIRHPQKIEPNTVMPEMGVTTSDARDIAAYLYTLR